MSIAWVALGSNENDPVLQIIKALNHLSGLPKTCVKALSSMYLTKPWGGVSQTNFINAVCSLETQLSAFDLFAHLKAVEMKQGRKSTELNGPRPIDLDLLLFDTIRLQTERLSLPHPRLHERDFVLQPLADIAPLHILSNGNTVKKQLELCIDRYVIKPLCQTNLEWHVFA